VLLQELEELLEPADDAQRVQQSVAFDRAQVGHAHQVGGRLAELTLQQVVLQLQAHHEVQRATGVLTALSNAQMSLEDRAAAA
jgi:hypothetical protein